MISAENSPDSDPILEFPVPTEPLKEHSFTVEQVLALNEQLLPLFNNNPEIQAARYRNRCTKEFILKD